MFPRREAQSNHDGAGSYIEQPERNRGADALDLAILAEEDSGRDEEYPQKEDRFADDSHVSSPACRLA